MRVVTLRDFHDNLKDVDRKRGEVFIVTRERFEQINSIGMEKTGANLVAESADGPKPTKQTPEKRASAAKSARKGAAEEKASK